MEASAGTGETGSSETKALRDVRKRLVEAIGEQRARRCPRGNQDGGNGVAAEKDHGGR